MKRSLIFCAIALVAVAANSVSAAVDVQLNLRYTNPADEAAGGTWDLLVKSNGTGVAGLTVLVDNVTNAAAAGSAAYGVFQTQLLGTIAEIVTGHDAAGLTGGASDIGLGAGTTGAVADDLFPGNSPIWDNSALLASGDFGAIRPSFVASSGTQVEGVNELSGATAVATTFGTQSVRGDGVATDGLLPGDANRDGAVDGTDLTILGGNWLGVAGWDGGDFNSSLGVDGTDLTILGGNWLSSAVPPAVGAVTAVPEPTSVVLLCAGILALAGARRRS